MSWGNIRETFTESLTASISDVANISVNHVEVISIELSVTGDPLASFSIYGRFHPAGTYNELYSSSADFNTPTGLLIGTSGDLTVLNSTGWFIMDTRGLDLVKIKGSSSGTTTLGVLAGG